jgi:hypothetical protein
MITILYTNTDKIRAALGVDDNDVKDARIVALDLEKELKLDFISWLPLYSAFHTTSVAPSATEAQRNIGDALVLYSMYYCATQVAKTLRLAAPQTVSDGKNALGRFDGIDWQALTINMKERAAFYRTLLLDQTHTSIVKFYPQLTGVGLATDPVVSAG